MDKRESPTPDELIEAGNEAVQEALGLCATQPHKLTVGPPASTGHDLEELADGIYSSAPKNWIVQYISGELRQQILALESVRRFKDLLVGLNLPLTQFGQLVGNAYSQNTSDFDSLMFQNLLSLASRGGVDYTYRAEIVVPVLQDVVSVILRSVIAAVHFVPLTGCALQSPLNLGNNLVIRRMSADEVSFALHMSAVSGTQMPGGIITIDDTSRWALTWEVELPAVAGPFVEPAPTPPDLLDIADTFARAAAVTTGGSVVPTHQLLKNKPTALGSTWSGSASPRYVTRANPKHACRIATSDHSKLVAVYGRLSDSPSPQYLLAAARICDSYTRMTAADQLVDLVIAVEAIFVPTGTTTELSFRASLNLSLLLRENSQLSYKASRAQVFVVKVYGLRSKLVHGDQINENRLPDLLDGSRPQGLSSVAEDLRRLISTLMVELLQVNHKVVPDWHARLTDILDS